MQRQTTSKLNLIVIGCEIKKTVFFVDGHVGSM